ncbi:MAG TPA: carboxymuconolactone decarboxylase family protein [Bryobacteraceae bacterium]|nr:carboxymuconolactone decarboxylase family protein [Bryobacteraceae bacterium]
MTQRIDYMTTARGVYEAMSGIEKYLAQASIEQKLRDLVILRASQINHCAYCIDMHWKDARVHGENEQRLYGLDAWRESPYYDERERAALEWTEAITNVRETGAPDEVYEVVKKHFSEKELADLTLTIAAINAWNRLAIAARAPAGTYQAKAASARRAS